MASDPSPHQRAMLGLAAILTLAAGAVLVGISFQERGREPLAATPPATTAPSSPARVTKTIGATTTMVPHVSSPASMAPGIAGARVTADGRPLRVVEVSLRADPADYTGPCPTTIRFHGTIRVEGRGTVSYTFPRSDQARGPVKTIEVESASAGQVETQWTLGRHSENPVERWQTLQIVAPRPLTSERATFRITCVP